MIDNRSQIKASHLVYSHILGGPLFSNHPVSQNQNHLLKVITKHMNFGPGPVGCLI